MTKDTIDGTLTTDEIFFDKVRKWANLVRAQANANAARFSKGKQNARTYKKGLWKENTEEKLNPRVTYKIRKYKGQKLSHVGFDFPLHGIFRTFGVGRGQPAQGSKKQAIKVRVKRSMSDWFNDPINKNVEQLAEMAAEYYGDKVLSNVYGMGKKMIV